MDTIGQAQKMSLDTLYHIELRGARHDAFAWIAMNRGLRRKGHPPIFYGHTVSATKRTFVAVVAAFAWHRAYSRAERVSKIEQMWTESVASVE